VSCAAIEQISRRETSGFAVHDGSGHFDVNKSSGKSKDAPSQSAESVLLPSKVLRA
jgi:hypothetical protein